MAVYETFRLEIGEQATRAEAGVAVALRAFRSDAALVKYFGDPSRAAALPGLPRPVDSLARDREQDRRVVQALKGMLISPDEPIMLIDKTLFELTGVNLGKLNEKALRKGLKGFTPKSQVIDFACNFEKLVSGAVKGGHQREAYARDDAIALIPPLKDVSRASIAGLETILSTAFDIAEAQIDTNPGSIQERRLTGELNAAIHAADAGKASRVIILG